MKKFITAAALITAATTNAQEAKTYGVKLGFNASLMGSAKVEEVTRYHQDIGGKSRQVVERRVIDTHTASEMAFGALAGAYVSSPLGDLLGIEMSSGILGVQAEAVFSMQGGTFPQGAFVDSTTDRHTLRRYFINVPLLLTVKPISTLPFSIVAGPQFGFCIVNSIYEGGTKLKGEPIKNEKKEIIGDAVTLTEMAYEVFDFSAVIGVQYTFYEHLQVGVRYNIGIVSQLGYVKKKDAVGTEIATTGRRNNVLQVSVGWTF